MKKLTKTLVLGVLLSLPMMLMAQDFSILRNDYHQSSFDYRASQASLSMQAIDNQAYTVVSLPGAAPSTAIGRPNLPVVTEFVEVPLCQNVKVSISNVETKALEDVKYPVMPVQPAPSKSDVGPLPFVIDNQFYASNQLTEPAAWVEVMGVARDRNVAILRICPFAYNPVTGQLQQVLSMNVTLTYEGANVAATEQMHARYYSPDFSLGKQFISTLPAGKDVRTAAPLHYLIVAHSSFRGHLDDFINWKKRQGFIVTVGYTDEPNVGTTSTSIAAYTKSFYTNATAELPAPTYLLLVGDDAQIPTFNSRCSTPASDHITDLYYVTWTDGDNIPDCYQGRFSARTADELTPQIEKTLLYEGYRFDDDRYLSKAVLIAGVDGGYSSDNAYRYSDPAMDYIAKVYVNASNGYNTVTYYKNNVSFAPTGVTVTGSCSANSTASALRSLYNEGAGWINYSAHGYDDSWSIPSFTCSNASQMTNYGKPGIMIGNCCLSGKFNTTAYSQCLGEALLRKGSNAGAVAYFGGTNSTYWPHDFCWAVGVRSAISGTMNADYDASHLGMYDRLFHTHSEPFSAWHHTAGSMNVAGNTAVQEYGSYQLYYWEIYELFGDPSLMPWLGCAHMLRPQASPILFIGSATYDVETVPYAYVALTTADEHNLIAAAYADVNGVAHLNVPSNITPGTIELSIWAQNYRPYFQNVTVSMLNGPYVTVLNAEAEATATPDQMVPLNITLSNLGNDDAGVCQVSVSSSDATVVAATTYFASCPAGDTITLSSVCPVYIPATKVNGDHVTLTISVDFGSETPSTKTVQIPVVAASLSLVGATANPNLYAGANATVTVNVTNRGGLESEDLTFALECPYGFFASEPDAVHQGVMAVGQTATLTFPISIDASAPQASLPMNLVARAANGNQQVFPFELRCGSSSIEDFESNGFTAYSWTQGQYAWEITNSDTYAGAYSARSKSSLSDRRESSLSINWTSGVDDSISFFYKVSSESGYDFFYFDIDGEEVLNASGEEGWTRAAFFVPAGTHTFQFRYTKDYSQSRGSDCAWIDNVSFPYTGIACQFAADTVCQGSEYEFAGQSVNTAEIGTLTLFDQQGNIPSYLALTVLPAPDVTIEVIRVNTECHLLKAHGASYYEWSTGEHTSAIAVSPTEVTTYTVTGTRGNCSSTASTTLLDIADMGASAVQLYPNPAHDRVVVAADGMRSVQLVNLMGQVVETRHTQSDALTLDLSNLPAGVYFVRVETASNIVVKKLIRK